MSSFPASPLDAEALKNTERKQGASRDNEINTLPGNALKERGRASCALLQLDREKCYIKGNDGEITTAETETTHKQIHTEKYINKV